MQGIERSYLEFAVKAIAKVYGHFLATEVKEILNGVYYGKKDTKGVDAIPEILLKETLEKFSKDAVLITEENDKYALRDLPDSTDLSAWPLIFISDPTDRSKFILRLLDEMLKQCVLEKSSKKTCEEVTVRQLFKNLDPFEFWKKVGEDPIKVTGPTTSLSCIDKGQVLFSVLANYITGDMTIACESGVYGVDLNNFSDDTQITLRKVLRKENEITFLSIRSRRKKLKKRADIFNDFKRFVTFLGDKNKKGYQENFRDSMIFMGDGQAQKFVHHKQPGGPARILYHSEYYTDKSIIGFIMANGEKITEWIHWLPYVRFVKNSEGSRAFRMFEIFTDRLWSKGGILMSTPPAYSIFRKKRKNDNSYFLNVHGLRSYDQPSHFRSMIVIAPSDNEWIVTTMKKYNYREIVF
jgi:hypothetical protein